MEMQTLLRAVSGSSGLYFGAVTKPRDRRLLVQFWLRTMMDHVEQIRSPFGNKKAALFFISMFL